MLTVNNIRTRTLPEKSRECMSTAIFTHTHIYIHTHTHTHVRGGSITSCAAFSVREFLINKCNGSMK